MAITAIASALVSLAPSIAGWLGGDKAEDAANSVVDIARKVTGVNDSEKAVDMVLEDENLKLQYMIQLDRSKAVFDEMYLKDRQHAREQHKHSIMPSVIVVSLTLMVGAMGAALFMSVIPEANQTLANILFGAVLAKWADSVAYWVGSSRGSAEKQKQIK